MTNHINLIDLFTNPNSQELFLNSVVLSQSQATERDSKELLIEEMETLIEEEMILMGVQL